MKLATTILALSLTPCLCAQERSKPLEVTFWASVAGMTTAQIMDTHSTHQALSRGYVESNPLASTGASIAISAIIGGLGYTIHRYGPSRLRWVGSAMVGAWPGAHFESAHHNYGLR